MFICARFEVAISLFCYDGKHIVQRRTVWSATGRNGRVHAEFRRRGLSSEVPTGLPELETVYRRLRLPRKSGLRKRVRERWSRLLQFFANRFENREETRLPVVRVLCHMQTRSVQQKSGQK